VSAQLDQLIAHLTRTDAEPKELQPDELRWLEQSSDEAVDQLLQALGRADIGTLDEADVSSVLRHLVFRVQPWLEQRRRKLPPTTVSQVAELYRRFGPQRMARGYLLQLLSASGGRDELSHFCELVVTDPPQDPSAALLALGPLFQHVAYDATVLFPRLLDAIAHPSVAVPVIDLANYLARRGVLKVHPGTERKQPLMQLLGDVVQRLSRIEEHPADQGLSREELAQQIEESIALAVSLCDALALIGDPTVIGKLYQAFEIGHRRLHTEAAAALARFGEEAGKASLAALAADPVTRLRALAYADELGLSDRIDEQFRSPASRAESELALWLAQPAQMGIPPVHIELIDSRTLSWPGYNEPVECFLFRFEYHFGGDQYSNVGIVGPLVRAFAADLLDLPVADIYATFAGWHAQHEDIHEREVNELTEAQRVDVARLERRLRDEGYDAIQPTLWGMFLGDRVLVARATRSGQSGVAVTDLQESLWFPAHHRERSIGPAEALCIYKGRRLLGSFNENLS